MNDQHPAAVAQMEDVLPFASIMGDQPVKIDRFVVWPVGVEAHPELPFGECPKRQAIANRRIHGDGAKQIGEGLVERRGAILGIVDDERLGNAGDGVVQPALGQLRRRFRFLARRDVDARAVVPDEFAAIVETGRAANRHPPVPSVRMGYRTDDVAIRLSRACRLQRPHAESRIIADHRQLQGALAEHVRDLHAEQRFERRRRRDEAHPVLRILLPIEVRADFVETSEALLAFAQGLLGLDLRGDAVGVLF